MTFTLFTFAIISNYGRLQCIGVVAWLIGFLLNVLASNFDFQGLSFHFICHLNKWPWLSMLCINDGTDNKLNFWALPQFFFACCLYIRLFASHSFTIRTKIHMVFRHERHWLLPFNCHLNIIISIHLLFFKRIHILFSTLCTMFITEILSIARWSA